MVKYRARHRQPLHPPPSIHSNRSICTITNALRMYTAGYAFQGSPMAGAGNTFAGGQAATGA